MYTPTLHKPVPMGAEVIVPAEYTGRTRKGKVVGIASIHVVFQYIILLDDGEEIESEYGIQRALTVAGPALEAPDGTHWRLG